MIGAAEDAGFLDAEDIDWAFYDTDLRRVAAGIVAENSGLAFGEAAAGLTELNLIARGE